MLEHKQEWHKMQGIPNEEDMLKEKFKGMQ